MSRHRQRFGLTMVEVLVVIAIIGVLAGLLLPAVQRVRESGRRVSCANNLSQIGKAMSGYEARDGRFPAAGRGYSWCNSGTSIAAKMYFNGDIAIYNSNGLVELLPFLELMNVYTQFDLLVASSNCGGPSQPQWITTDRPTMSLVGSSAQNAQAATIVLSIFRCASDFQTQKGFGGPYADSSQKSSGVAGKTAAATNYDFISMSMASPFQNFTEQNCNAWAKAGIERRMFGQNSRTTPAHVLDGLSNVVAFGETTVDHWTGQGISWGQRCHTMMGIDPTDINNWQGPSQPASSVRAGYTGITTRAFASLHPGGAQVAMGDGTVRFISESTSNTVMNMLARIRDGNPGPID